MVPTTPCWRPGGTQAYCLAYSDCCPLFLLASSSLRKQSRMCPTGEFSENRLCTTSLWASSSTLLMSCSSGLHLHVLQIFLSVNKTAKVHFKFEAIYSEFTVNHVKPLSHTTVFNCGKINLFYELFIILRVQQTAKINCMLFASGQDLLLFLFLDIRFLLLFMLSGDPGLCHVHGKFCNAVSQSDLWPWFLCLESR